MNCGCGPRFPGDGRLAFVLGRQRTPSTTIILLPSHAHGRLAHPPVRSFRFRLTTARHFANLTSFAAASCPDAVPFCANGDISTVDPNTIPPTVALHLEEQGLYRGHSIRPHSLAVMDLDSLLAGGAAAHADGQSDHDHQGRQYPTRGALSSQTILLPPQPYAASMPSPTRPSAAPSAAPSRPSPGGKQQKQVTFVLVFPEAQNRARLPMRVMISPHDNTASIITTVKNFYGLYEGPGLIFKDQDENILIASYENFEPGMVVNVYMTAPDPAIAAASVRSRSVTQSPRKPKLGAPLEMRPPKDTSRPASRATYRRSHSPQSIRSHRSTSALAGPKSSRVRPFKPRDADPYADGSDSDGGNGSVTSSRREAHVSAEISVDNIVEGGRRKRAKFDSSELPLFVPPQVPASNSISSVSPQRRINGETLASPYAMANQRAFTFHQPLPSPQSYTRPDNYTGHHPGYGQYSGVQYRSSGPVNYGPPRQSTGGILPTPEPTACSTISDEDVALQLMRLGDASNFSYGRTSTSTMDDALSGKAEVASSDEESDEDVKPFPKIKEEPNAHSAGPRRKKQRTLETALPSADSIETSSDEDGETSFQGHSDAISPAEHDQSTPELGRRSGKSKSAAPSKRDSTVGPFNRSNKSRLPGPPKSKTNPTSASKVPMSPASLPSQSRKTSAASSTINFQAQYGVDEEDLSSKPRCQRCRKSKKGCDRQRPCGRCKDAGICADGCISEDEGNGRKGRYGRHMGVPVKKDAELALGDMLPSTTHEFISPALPSEKNKKRKR